MEFVKLLTAVKIEIFRCLELDGESQFPQSIQIHTTNDHRNNDGIETVEFQADPDRKTPY